MKKTMLLVTFGLFLLTGCSEETIDTQIEQKSDLSFYVLKTINGETSWEEQTFDAEIHMNPTRVSQKSNNGNSTHTHGSLDSQGLQITWSGTDNNGGAHGTATISQQLGPFDIIVTVETDCINSDGNLAVYTGRVISAEGNNPGFLGFIFGVGGQASFRVIDNGQGNKAPADQFGGLAVTPPPFFGPLPQVCESIGQPDSAFWTSTPTDIPAPGSVKINN
jgi:hypothetical protein